MKQRKFLDLNGDKIVAADGEKIERFSDVPEKILLSKTITVDRDGAYADIGNSCDVVDVFLKNKNQPLFFLEYRKRC